MRTVLWLFDCWASRLRFADEFSLTVCFTWPNPVTLLVEVVVRPKVTSQDNDGVAVWITLFEAQQWGRRLKHYPHGFSTTKSQFCFANVGELSRRDVHSPSVCRRKNYRNEHRQRRLWAKFRDSVDHFPPLSQTNDFCTPPVCIEKKDEQNSPINKITNWLHTNHGIRKGEILSHFRLTCTKNYSFAKNLFCK